MPNRINGKWREAGFQFWALVAFLVIVFFSGGSSRADVQSLVLLRPLAVLVCGAALLTLSWSNVRSQPTLFGMAAAILALLCLHLVPLPPAIWSALPGREMMVGIDETAQLGQVWRPLTMSPSSTWNALYALFVPLAVLLLGIQIDRNELFKLHLVVLSLGLLSGFWGFLQATGDPGGSLYLYRITNNGSAVGLFANRNHQAVLLATLFPMLAVFASAGIKTEERAKLNGGIAIAVGAALIPLILVTGSRTGLLCGVLGLLSAGLLYRKPNVITPKKRKIRRFDPKYILIAAAVSAMGALTVLMSRAEALRRLSIPDQSEDLRWKIWAVTADAASIYFPVGSGIGSFAPVFQMHEPQKILGESYVNQAHNDWLDLYLTSGVSGMLLCAIALVLTLLASLKAFRSPIEHSREVPFARLGAIIIGLIAIGSAADYPLRTPIMGCVSVVALLWLSGNRASRFEKAGNH